MRRARRTCGKYCPASRTRGRGPEMAEAERADLVCLMMVPGVGPHTCRALLERFGSATGVLDAPPGSLRAVAGVGKALADRIARARRELDPAAELALCRGAEVAVIARGDPDYPPYLEEIADPPCLL